MRNGLAVILHQLARQQAVTVKTLLYLEELREFTKQSSYNVFFLPEDRKQLEPEIVQIQRR